MHQPEHVFHRVGLRFAGRHQAVENPLEDGFDGFRHALRRRGHIRVILPEGVHRHLQCAVGNIGNALDFVGKLFRNGGIELNGFAGNRDRVIADALKLDVQANNRRNRAKMPAARQMNGDELMAAFVNFVQGDVDEFVA